MKNCDNCANYKGGITFPGDACQGCITEYVNGERKGPSHWEPIPKTNADRIRAMSDRELAYFLADKYVKESCMRLNDEGYEPTATQIEAIKHTLYCTWMNWLQQPAEDDK